MKRYSNDPYWLRVKYPTTCTRCGVDLRKGYEAFYYPTTRKMYCVGACGQSAYADFVAHAQDEEMYNANP